jgi:hypothetical protein
VIHQRYVDARYVQFCGLSLRASGCSLVSAAVPVTVTDFG